MGLTRRDFQRIALILAKHRKDMPCNTHGLLVEDFADYCLTTNKWFKRDKFFEVSEYYGKPERTSE
jgi:hypothetical protein